MGLVTGEAGSDKRAVCMPWLVGSSQGNALILLKQLYLSGQPAV